MSPILSAVEKTGYISGIANFHFFRKKFEKTKKINNFEKNLKNLKKKSKNKIPTNPPMSPIFSEVDKIGDIGGLAIFL